MSRRFLCSCLFFLIGAPILMSDDAPSWLHQAAASALPAYGKTVPYVVLRNETRVEVEESGRITKTVAYALKILLKEGREDAVAQVVYVVDMEKVRELRAWLIQPNGKVKKYEKDETIDTALASNDIYNDVRRKLISARPEAEVGAVFGYEIVTEERSIFSQDGFIFQAHAPVLNSRFTVILPSRWTLEYKIFNHTDIKPVVNGSAYTWELRDLPPVEPEPLSPSIANFAPRLALSIFPPAGVSSILSFKTWSDVSRWLVQMNDPQVMVNQEMINKAKELTANASSEYEKIGAIARYCQSIIYVSIQMGLGRGGGFRPHAATEVFGKEYGDCKDKANLMRALLKAIGITAYPVSIFLGDRYYVREEWPSPHQFNHCIIGVKISEPVNVPAVVQHEKLGSVLIFDPTDPNIRLGDIPKSQQGSLALIVAEESGALIRMPTAPPELSRTERTLDVELFADGSIHTRIKEEVNGAASADARAEMRELSPDAYNKMIESWISRTVTGAKIEKIEPQNDADSGRASLEVVFSARGYGRLMQGRLLAFNPTVVSRRDFVDLTEPIRRMPIVIESTAFSENVSVKLPSGFAVDEVPDAVDIDLPFGSYHAECKANEGSLLYSRSVILRNAIFPAQEYERAKNFFLTIRNSELSPVVLIKQ